MSLTLAMVKPDAVASGKTGKILAHLEGGGFRVVALRMTRLSRRQAEAFYEVPPGPTLLRVFGLIHVLRAGRSYDLGV